MTSTRRRSGSSIAGNSACLTGRAVVLLELQRFAAPRGAWPLAWLSQSGPLGRRRHPWTLIVERLWTL